ncbi:MAG: glycosyltransferase [Anaerolineae bacterium]|nr:glycosyltransferase [Anaerolineae bacterium]
MRIGMMVDIYKPHVSGVTNHIALNKKYMEAAGHEVFIFTFGGEDFQDDESNVIRSEGISFEVPQVEGRVNLNFKYNRRARKLLETMDVVHAHHPFISGILAMRYCRPRGIPIVFTNHTRYDLYYQAYLPMLPENLGERFLHMYMPYFCKSCDLVIVPSASIRQVLQSFGVFSELEVVPNGVDLSQIRINLDAMDRSAAGFSEQDVVCIFVGRLGPEKNIPLLLKAFSEATKTHEHGRLLLVGDGPDRKKFESEAATMGMADKVLFTGSVPYENMPGYLGMADMFVTASVTEVHPLTVMEAMAAGLPVLGIHSPGIADTVKDGVTGRLSNGQPEDFRAKLSKMFEDVEARKKMGQQAFQDANDFSIEITSHLLLEKYRELIVMRERGELKKTGALDKLLSRLRP